MFLPSLAMVLQLQAVAAAPAPAAAATPRDTPDPSPAVFHARNGQVDVPMGSARRDSVSIDGRLDEPVWATAPVLTGFSLYNPSDGRPAPDSTDVRIWYSPTALYIGIRAFEPHGAVRATLADRDRIAMDDYVEIHLDPFQERRRAVVFMVNPFGIQADGTKAEGGGFIPGSNIAPGQNDLSADFLWQSRGRVLDDGYEVELRIPFTSLRFPVKRVQRWGIQFSRKVQHSGYEQTWTPVRRGAASFIAQEGYLSGLTGLERGVDILVNPELTNTTAGRIPSGGVEPWEYVNTPRVGGNVRVGLGSNLVLNGTVRPDFSQVEADATQVAADPRFALFYPERRPFFVEGAEAFNVPNTLVYTRRIVQPDAALKLTGRLGRANIAVLSALDAPPGTNDREQPLVDVVRITRDFRLQSQAGLVYSDRVSEARTNRMGGVDVRHVFGGMYYASGQYVASTTRAGASRTSGALWEGVVDRTGRRWGFHYNLLGIQPGFRTDNGFVARTGFVQPNAANRVTFFGKPGGFFERYMVFVQANGIWRYDDFFAGRSLLESRASTSHTLTFRRGWSLGMTPAYSTFAFDPAAYGSLGLAQGTGVVPFTPSPRITAFSGQVSLSTPQFRRFAASASLLQANDVDFAETARARRTAVSGSLDWRPNTQLRVNATYASNEFIRRRDGTSTFSTQIPRLKAEYQMTRSVFVRLVTQYEASRRETLVDWRTGAPLLTRRSDGSYVPTSASRSNLLRADWLFAFRPSPGTVFFAGYGNSLTEPDALAFERLRRVNDGFFVKASWVNRWGAR
ncbi:MAG: carbohydrate binding family 9 domain-containing protein [Gemmatimonadetes bacterium]|nr:carbohydrate binding family 9 domain-containing protein [Gemmatimonadota bacterium]